MRKPNERKYKILLASMEDLIADNAELREEVTLLRKQSTNVDKQTGKLRTALARMDSNGVTRRVVRPRRAPAAKHSNTARGDEDRGAKLLKALKGGEFVGAPQLAQKLGVSKMTVAREIVALRKAGKKIKGVRGKGYALA